MKITDIETNGLLANVSKFHCGVIYTYETDEYTKFRPHDFEAYLNDLEAEVERGGLIVFHNGHKYDVPVLEKLEDLNKASMLIRKKPFRLPVNQVLDTLVMSRLLFPNLKDSDMVLFKQGKLAGNLIGRHSLESWGYRLGEMKGEYKDEFKAALKEQGEAYVDGMEWAMFSESMLDYNVQDVVVTKTLFEHFTTVCPFYFPHDAGVGATEAERFWNQSVHAVKLEHEAAWLLAKMERNGYPINVTKLTSLYEVLATRRSELLVTLVQTFGSWYQPKGGKEQFLAPKSGRPLKGFPKVNYPKMGGMTLKDGLPDSRDTFKGAPFTPITHVTFNPASRDHIIRVLKNAGWVPIEFTAGGNPIVDDEVLEMVEVEDHQANKCIRLIQEYLMIQKRIGQVAEGDNAWLKMVGTDGRIHGSINPNGAVTGRATHSYHNVAQVPSIENAKGVVPYGAECREAWGAEHNPDGPWIQVGVDASGLELRCLGHFMYRFDEGEYVDTILNGDIHTKNQLAAGLPTRSNAKTFIYGFLYGAGAAKIGQIVNGTATEGKALIKRFLDGTPALAALRESLSDTLVSSSRWVGGEQKVTWRRRWVRGLDGRRIHIRMPHAALNSVLQGAGAVICKEWIVETDKRLQQLGLVQGWSGDYALMGWIHDEQQFACRTQEIAETVVRVAQEAMRAVGDFYKFRCQLDTEGKIGKNWKDCH